MTSTRIPPQENAAQFTLERFDAPPTPPPAKWFGAVGQQGPVYVIGDSDKPLWSVGIDFGAASHVPFREELFWDATNAIVIGGGNLVYVFDAQNGKLRAEIPIPSLFGHLAIASVPTASGDFEEILFILGWTDVHAIDSKLETRWIARDVAVDGIVFSHVDNGSVILAAEMDPPGGWVGVALDVFTGVELWREWPLSE